MKCDTISISSDEDVPLNVLETIHTDSNSSACLNSRSIQPCEFCDEVFLNRYTALIHNASHIIIPLLKQTVHQCMECLFCFTSQPELQHHKETKHKEIKIQNEDNKPDVLHMAISDIVRKELDVKLEDYLIQNKLQSPKKIKEEIHIKEEVEEVVENGVDTADFPNVNGDNFKISSRLHFEGDSDDESDDPSSKCNVGHSLLDDLTTACKVNLNLFDKPWVDDGSEKGTVMEVVQHSNSIDTAKEESAEPSISEFTSSVHYEDLIKPGMYRCKRCSERFPTKFHLIQHDMCHVKIRKPRPLLCIYCERFISNIRACLRAHVDKLHDEDTDNRPKQLPTCKICGLKFYNYIRHARNYHVAIKSEETPKPKDDRPVFFCQWCNRAFRLEEERSEHINTKHLVEKKCHRCGLVSTAIEVHEHQKTCLPVFPDPLEPKFSYNAMLKVCDTCCMFLKNRHNIQYSVVNTVSEVGSRMDCERCGKKFFELKLVKRITVKRSSAGPHEKKKHLSNKARLKNIQQRLKMFNKLSRC